MLEKVKVFSWWPSYTENLVSNNFSKPEGLGEAVFYLLSSFPCGSLFLDYSFITFSLISRVYLVRGAKWSLKHEVYIHQVFVLTFCIFFLAPFSLWRLPIPNCLFVLTVPAITLWPTDTHIHGHGCLPHTQTLGGLSMTSKRHPGQCGVSMMLKHTHAHPNADWSSLTCVGGTHSRQTWLSASKLACALTLAAIIRLTYLEIRGNSENKASSKAKWEREKWVNMTEEEGRPSQ